MKKALISKYGLAATKAVKFCTNGLSPRQSWNKATLELFGNTSTQKRGGPITTFLSLCKIGLVKGVPTGDYTRAESSLIYASKGVEVLESNKNKKYTSEELWNEVQNKELVHRNQMDVVLALWNNELIEKNK